MGQVAVIDLVGSNPQIATQFDGDLGSAIPIANLLTIEGLTVANSTFSKPIFVTASGATLVVNAQLGVAVTGVPVSNAKAGLSCYDDTAFNVDATTGYVTLAGGAGPAVDSIAVDDITAPGVTPVGPTAGGVITVAGESVAAHGVPIETRSRALHAYNIEVQVASAVAGAPADRRHSGLSSYDNSIFSANAQGYVSLTTTGLAETITGDTGGALSPVANNWNIVGGTNVATAGSGSTLTINATGFASFTWVEETGATRALVVNQGVVGNRGTTITMTLPATAAQFSTFRFTQKGAGSIKIAQNDGQTIHFLGQDTTTGAGGSIESSNQWDAIELICTTADTDFGFLSGGGNWIIT